MRWRALQLVGVEAIYFFRLVIVAAILTPEAFGVIAVAVNIVGVLVRLSNFGMVPALVQSQGATREQYDAAWTIGLLRGAAVVAILFVSAPFVAAFYRLPEAAPVIQVLALRPLLDGAASIGVARLTRELRFRQLATIQLAGALVDFAISVATAGRLGVWALVVGTLGGAATAMVVSYIVAPHRPRLWLASADVLVIARFGRWVLFASILSLVGTTTTQIVISRELGAAALGAYFLAAKVAFLPFEAAHAIVGNVAFPLFAQLRGDRARSTVTFDRLLGMLTITLLPIYAIMFVLAPSLPAVLGGEWDASVSALRILAVGSVFAVVGHVLAPLVLGRGRADQAFALEVAHTGTLLLVLWPLVVHFAVDGVALAWGAGHAVALILGLCWLTRMREGGTVIRAWIPATAAGAAVAAALVAGAIWSWSPNTFGAVLAGAAGVAAASGTILILDRALHLDLGQLLSWLKGLPREAEPAVGTSPDESGAR